MWRPPPSLGAPRCCGGGPRPGCRRLHGAPGDPRHLHLPQVLFQGSQLLNSGVGAFVVVVFVSCICCPFYTATLASSWKEVRSDEASPYKTHLLLLLLLCLLLGVGGLGVVQVTNSTYEHELLQVVFAENQRSWSVIETVLLVTGFCTLGGLVVCYCSLVTFLMYCNHRDARLLRDQQADLRGREDQGTWQNWLCRSV